MNAVSSHISEPSILAKISAPIARIFLNIQNKVFGLLGLRNSDTANMIIGAVGAVTMYTASKFLSVLGPVIGPAVIGVGSGILIAGAAGLLLDSQIKRIAASDKKGGK